jgi:hypothetical protein
MQTACLSKTVHNASADLHILAPHQIVDQSVFPTVIVHPTWPVLIPNVKTLALDLVGRTQNAQL